VQPRSLPSGRSDIDGGIEPDNKDWKTGVRTRKRKNCLQKLAGIL